MVKTHENINISCPKGVRNISGIVHKRENELKYFRFPPKLMHTFQQQAVRNWSTKSIFIYVGFLEHFAIRQEVTTISSLSFLHFDVITESFSKYLSEFRNIFLYYISLFFHKCRLVFKCLISWKCFIQSFGNKFPTLILH